MSDQPKSAPCRNHHTHTYHFNELSLGTGSNEQPYFRALIFFNKKPDVTDEFFHDHWKSVHADLTLRTPDAGVNLTRYVQFHQEAKHKAELEPLLQASGGSMQMLPYDGCAEFHARTAKDFITFMNSVFSSDQLVGCGKRFADVAAGYHVMFGYDNLIFGHGIPTTGGGDGVLAGDARLKTVQQETTDFDPSAMLTICVGPTTDQKNFLVHESFLTTRSEFFKRAMNGRWTESATRTISLADDDPDTFALYLNHVYKNELPTMAKSKEELHAIPSSQISEHVHEEYMALFRLYILAEKIQDVSAKNEVIAAVFRLAFIARPNEKFLVPGRSVVRLVYNGTLRGSLARSLMVGLWSGPSVHNVQQLGSSLPKDFILDLAVAFSGMLSTKRQHPAERKGVGAYLEAAKSSRSKGYSVPKSGVSQTI